MAAMVGTVAFNLSDRRAERVYGGEAKRTGEGNEAVECWIEYSYI